MYSANVSFLYNMKQVDGGLPLVTCIHTVSDMNTTMTLLRIERLYRVHYPVINDLCCYIKYEHGTYIANQQRNVL